VRVLTWNLYHGRARPPAGRSLRAEFAAALAGWEWDVALLQEVPPWWPPELARACDATAVTALTSRNSLLALRRFVADRWPDLIRSNGGGANALLSRAGALADHRVQVLRRRPERRVAHGARLPDGTWIVNLHATVHDARKAHEDLALARETALAWAGDAPIVLGGDFNIRDPDLPGFTRAAGHDVDFIFTRGLEPAGPGAALEHGPLSDHAPVLARLEAPNVPQYRL
jgi:endonuclease/exonuclease/phosphatase family metal-dependent hydrolase